MQYKTIVLHLLEHQSAMYDRLRRERLLLPTLDRYATELKSRHTAWTERLRGVKPGSDESQVASEALEIALRELEASLPTASSTGEADTPPLG